MNGTLQREKTSLFNRIYAIAAVLVICFDVVTAMWEWKSSDSYTAAFWLPMSVMLVMYFWKLRGTLLAEEKVLTVYLIWNVLSRVILGDLSGGLHGSTLFSAGICTVFGMSRMLTDGQRRAVINWVTGIMGGILCFWSVGGILIVLTGIGYLPIIHKNIGLSFSNEISGNLQYVTFYFHHRNETAIWFLMGIGLMVYQWMNCRRKLWRLPIGAAIVLFYIALALQRCRTANLALGGGAAMLAVLLLMPRWGEKRWAVRWAAALLAAVVCLGAAFKGVDLVSSGLSRLSVSTSRMYAQWRGYTEPEEETTGEEIAITDSRDLLSDMKTMTGRSSIWRAIYRTRKADLFMTLVGQKENDVAPWLREAGGLNYNGSNAHNMLLQSLAEMGIPGMLLMLAFILLQLVRMVRVFFRSTVRLCDRALTIPMTMVLICGMVEAMLSWQSMFVSVCFAMCGAMVAAADRDKVTETAVF